MVRSASLAAAAFMLACNQVDLCSWHTQAIPADGGGPVRCLGPDDCPREGNAVTCESNGPPDKTCVRCVQGACERVVAERCQ